MSKINVNIPSASQENKIIGDAMNNCVESSEVVVPKSESTTSISGSDTKSDVANSNLPDSVPSKIARPAVLKLPSLGSNSGPTPSRIARLCNSVTKPTVPSNSSSTPSGTGVTGGTIMSTSSSIRKISEELAKKRLTDVDETDENAVPHFGDGKWSNDRKMSSGSVLSDSSRRSSRDDLRKKRASDASTSADSFSEFWKSDFEHRRASDASVVLTEDTDQFIIGDRVWVGGVKPGQIAYIGETQFAPGEWAGVVLDEPIGKNDGTVANIRYFQCEPKKGIFSRLTRLTRFPLADGAAGEPAATRPLPLETKKSNGTVSASKPKKSPLVLTPTAVSKNSVSKPASPDSAVPNVAVGDRVIIKSSQGSKAGILRYLGTTEFAPGEWCGVELDDPLGKNDGSVAGTRYFECRPKFGLFAPLHKVSKSPANKRLFQPCMIHRAGTPSGIRRQGSKESLVSMSSTTSTAASVRSTTRKIGARAPATPVSMKNSLQESLKQKELHIERLLKERDLERAEVTRAAGQADEAERQLAIIKKEFEQHKEVSEARISDLDAMVCLLKSEREEFTQLLDEERKKYEDLQFRFEEETIDKADIRANIAKYEEKINGLEKALSEERKRAEALEQDSNKLFEAEEQMVIIKDDLDTVREDLQEQKKVRLSLEQEHISLEAHLTSARAEIESLKMENQTLKSSASKDLSGLTENLSKAVRNLEESKKVLTIKEAEIEKLSEHAQEKDKMLIEKEKEIHANYSRIMQEMRDRHESELVALSQRSENLKSTLETKLKLLEGQLEDKVKFSCTLEAKLNEVSIQLSKTAAEKNVEQCKQKEVEEKLGKELRELTAQMHDRARLLTEEKANSEKWIQETEKLQQELNNVKASLSSTSEAATKEVSCLSQTVRRQEEELTNLKANMELKLKECDSLAEAVGSAKKEKEEKIKEMEKVMEGKNFETKKLKEELEKLKQEFETKNDEVQVLYRTHEESFKSKIRSLEDAETDLKAETDKLNKELERLKNSLEARENEVKSEQCHSKLLAEKLMALEENYRKVSEEKDQLQLDAGDAARKLQAVEEKLGQVSNQKLKLETDISNFINSSNDSTAQMTKLNEDLREKEREIDVLREEISEKTRNFERLEQELRQVLEKQEAELKISVDDREKLKKQYDEDVRVLKSKIEASDVALRKADDEWRRKTEALAKDSELQIGQKEEKIREMEKKEIEDRNKHEAYEKELLDGRNNLQNALKTAGEEAAETKNYLQKAIEELVAERNNLFENLEKAKSELKTSEKKLDDKAKKDLEIHLSEREKLKDELMKTQEKLTSTLEDLNKERNEKTKLEEEQSKLNNNNAALENVVKAIRERNAELEVSSSSAESENKILKNTISELREEKYRRDKEHTDHLMQVAELKSQLESLEYSKGKEVEEKMSKLENLERKIEELNDILQKTEATHSAESSEKDEQIRNLREQIEKFKDESSQIVSSKEKDIEKVNVVAEQLQGEMENCKKESKSKSQKIDVLEKNLQQLRFELESEKKKSEEYMKDCKAAEAKTMDLLEKIDNQEAMLSNSSNLVDKLNEMSKRLEEAERREQDVLGRTLGERASLESALESTKVLLKQKETEAETLFNQLESLKRENTLLINNKATVESLRKEKAELEKKMADVKLNEMKIQNDNGEDANNRLLEERELEKGQIDFLNSVIVDMQKKNDALKSRIEILERGFSPEEVDEFALSNINTRSVAPRLFCDICDRFDLHDTEDCPTQAMDEDEPNPSRSKSSKAKVLPPERPYCDICEVFGHDTLDCDDAETF